MVGQISPLVKAGKPHRIAVSHVAGGVAGGVCMGLCLGIAGVVVHALIPLADRGETVVLLVALVVAMLADSSVIPVRSIGTSRQTPRSWTCVCGEIGGVFAWGFDLGLVFTTRLASYTVLVLPLYAVLADNLGEGVLIFAVYGSVRALAVVAVSSNSSGDLGSVCSRMNETQGVRLRITALASAASVLVLVAL